MKDSATELLEIYQFGNFCSKLLVSPLLAATSNSDFVVADENTAALLPAAPDLVLATGEHYKTLAQVEQLIASFAARRLSRRATVLAFGGGVLCDLVGFAAASYMRGCGLILVPTTLLAMVDAGLGGKTGCNYQNYKNMIGAFYPAREVHLVPEVLATLPERDFRSGLAELCKHALLSDTAILWQKLLRCQGALRAPILAGEEAVPAAVALRELLFEGVRVKGKIVQRDLYEQGERAFLNLGHTYAHALEKVAAFACTHGEAVAWGLNQALHLSAHQGYCAPSYAATVRELLLSMGFVLELRELCPSLFAADSSGSEKSAAEVTAALLAAMELDKKRYPAGNHPDGEHNCGVRLVLQRGRGQTFVAKLPPELLAKTLQL